MSKMVPEYNELKEHLKSSMIEEPGKDFNRRILNRIARHQKSKKRVSDIPWIGIMVMVILVSAMGYFFSLGSFGKWDYFDSLTLNTTRFQFRLNPVFTLSVGALALASWGLILIDRIRKREFPM